MKSLRSFGWLCWMLAAAQGIVPALTGESLAANPFRSVFRSQEPEKDEPRGDAKAKAGADDFASDADESSTKVETPMIGDYTMIHGLNVITLHGVGLVTGLDGTGGDPPPSHFRTKLLEDMRKRGIPNPNEILQSPNTALVLVRAYLPPMCCKGDKFDIEVRVPGTDEVTSLNGGWLLETYLSEEAIVPGQGILPGHIFAKASGPILISTGENVKEKESARALVTRGKVIGGGVSMKDRDLALYLRTDFRSVRNSSRIAERIGTRFYDYTKSGRRDPLAEAKTDQKVELRLMPRYKENFPRYLQVVRSIAFRETDVAQRVRMQKLKERLATPETSERAAIELEAIGPPALPILKAALKNKQLEVRFHAAVALAYLGESDGLPVLAEAAREEPAFRVFAYAAMAAVEDAESHILLRELMSEKSPETRYGAFRALTTLDPNDPFLRGEKLNDEFQLHVLDTEGPPLIHMTNRRKAEVVLFGRDQEFRTPLAVRAGTKILVTGASGSKEVVVSRYEVGKPDRREVVSNRVADVIHKACEFGATYPDVAQLLVQADRQHNTPARIEIDALPKAGRYYERPVADATGEMKSKQKARVGRINMTPNMYSEDKDFQGAGTEKGSKEADEPADEMPAAAAGKKGAGVVQASAEEAADEPKKNILKTGGWSTLNPFRKKTSLIESESLDE